MPSVKQQPRILVAPLNWGLGHATRCIPIIEYLLEKEVDLHLGGDGGSLLLLEKAFPQLPAHQLPSYGVRYGSKRSFEWNMASQIPRLLKAIRAENYRLNSLIDEFDFDAVISDNRYGLWSRKTRTVFLSHQLRILLPNKMRALSDLLKWLNHFFIRRFDECWVPDFKDEPNLSGRLSHQLGASFEPTYIGPLSRLKELPNRKVSKNSILAVLSGPEPARTNFEKLLINKFGQVDYPSTIVRGITQSSQSKSLDNILLIDHLQQSELAEQIAAHRFLICRSGYSTIMDLIFLQKDAILIPTPAQTEQEYLAERLRKTGIFYSCSQDEFDLNEAIRQSQNYQVERLNISGADSYQVVVDRFLERL